VKIQGIAFDLEGTVVNVEDAHHNAHLMAMAEMGITMTLEEAIVKIPHFIGGPHEKIREEVYELSDKKHTASFYSERDGFYYEKLPKEMLIVPRSGWLEVIDNIKLRGIRVSIGSLTREDKAMHLLERSGLFDHFSREMIVLHGDVKEAKPAPDVFFETARRMGINPMHQLVFEDSPRGVQAARKAGSRAIGMPVYNIPQTLIPLI